MIIFLPAFTCGINTVDNVYNWDEMGCVTQEGLDFLEAKLDDYVANGALIPGFDNMGNRPGSSIAIARQLPEWKEDITHWDAKTGWLRKFYCENFQVGKYQIVYDGASDGCYIDM